MESEERGLKAGSETHLFLPPAAKSYLSPPRWVFSQPLLPKPHAHCLSRPSLTVSAFPSAPSSPLLSRGQMQMSPLVTQGGLTASVSLGPRCVSLHFRATFQIIFLKRERALTKERSGGEGYDNLLFLFLNLKRAEVALSPPWSPLLYTFHHLGRPCFEGTCISLTWLRDHPQPRGRIPVLSPEV